MKVFINLASVNELNCLLAGITQLLEPQVLGQIRKSGGNFEFDMLNVSQWYPGVLIMRWRRSPREGRGEKKAGGRGQAAAGGTRALRPPYAYCMEIHNWPSYSSFDELRDRSIMSGAAGAVALGRH